MGTYLIATSENDYQRTLNHAKPIDMVFNNISLFFSGSCRLTNGSQPVNARLLQTIWLTCLYAFSVLAMASTPTENRTLVLNTAITEPFCNASQTGYLDRLVGTAVERLGYRLESVHLPAERALIIANRGINDGEMLRIAGLDTSYPNLIQVPEKLIDMEFVAFTRDQSLEITGWDDLGGHSVAIIIGWKLLERKIPVTADLISVKNVDLLFTLLMKGRTDVILYTRWSGLAYIANHQLQGIRVLEPPLAQQSMYVYLHKQHRNLVPRLASELRELKNEGEQQRLFQEILLPYVGD